MALFKILKGDSSRLEDYAKNSGKEGYCYYTTDESKFYIQTDDNGTVEALNADNADTLDGKNVNYFYSPDNKPTAADVGVCNPNLLHNWYFLNPVDRYGGHHVESGITYYSDTTLTTSAGTTTTPYNADYGDETYGIINVDDVLYYVAPSDMIRGGYGGVYRGISRWNNNYSNNIVSILDDGVEWRNGRSEGSTWVNQKIGDGNGLPAGTYTYSALVTGVTGNCSIYFGNGGTSLKTIYTYGNTGLITGTLTTTEDGVLNQARISIPNGGAIKLAAIKLECGSVQTLAHQGENGNWVLNEVPDYAEQLALCSNYSLITGNVLENYTFKRAIGKRQDLDELVDIGIYYYLGSDAPANAPYQNNAIVEVIGSDEEGYVRIQRVTRYGGVTGYCKWRCLYDNKWTDWCEVLTTVDSSLTGALGFSGGQGKIIASSNGNAQIESIPADTTKFKRALQVFNSSAALSNAARLYDSETQKNYNLYGEHNKPTVEDVVIDAKSADYDMDTILKSGVHSAMYLTNSNTLGTPAKYGVSDYNSALIISYSGTVNYGFQLAIMNGTSCLFTRYLRNGTIGDWVQVYSASYKPTANDISAIALAQGTTLEDGTDLDTVTEVGNYKNIGSSRVFGNCPVSGTLFIMRVGNPVPEYANYKYQEIITINGRRYYRYATPVNSVLTWQEWMHNYDTKNKPTPEEIDAMRFYYSPTELGLTIGSETIETILTAMPLNSVLRYTVTSSHNASIYPYGYGIVEFIRPNTSSYAEMTFTATTNNTFFNHQWHGSANYANSKWTFSGWSKVYDTKNKPNAADVEAVALDGTSTMTGNLVINKTTPIVNLKDSAANSSGLVFNANNRLYLQAQNDSSSDQNRRQIQLADSNAQVLNKALHLVDIVNGTATGYALYGEHNKPTAVDVEAYSLRSTTSIARATDLNTITAFGNYHCSSTTATTDTLVNGPSGLNKQGFVLRVERCTYSTTNYCKQRLVTYNNPAEWWRVCTNGTWSDWHTIDDITKKRLKSISSEQYVCDRTTSGGGYYLQANGKNYGYWQVGTVGTAGDGTNNGTVGVATLAIGNSTAVSSTANTGANNARGALRIYSTTDNYHTLRTIDGHTANYVNYLPKRDGVLVSANAASSTAKRYLLGVSAVGSSATDVSVNSNANIYTQSGVLYGAAWNDYAEYRESDITEPGRVICENGDDTLSLSTERLQPGANVISDTFGFAIGETETAKTPIAVSGRVLVYPYENRDTYKPGDAVCAAPNGTVSKMTREEIREYPERIIGTVSAIPNYETWGTGNVSVNGRIWIKVK